MCPLAFPRPSRDLQFLRLIVLASFGSAESDQLSRTLANDLRLLRYILEVGLVFYWSGITSPLWLKGTTTRPRGVYM